jgi:hypothetical protein
MPEPDQRAERSDASQKLARPAITAPKGGGAIRGRGEKFAANPVTGTGSVSVPIATSPGRSGFGPQLGLTYDSGSGNGPFGFGWSLSVPAITRNTDKGLPEYRDGDGSDVYVLAGAEDLVPSLQADGTRLSDTTIAPGHVVHRQRYPCRPERRRPLARPGRSQGCRPPSGRPGCQGSAALGSKVVRHGG